MPLYRTCPQCGHQHRRKVSAFCTPCERSAPLALIALNKDIEVQGAQVANNNERIARKGKIAQDVMSARQYEQIASILVSLLVTPHPHAAEEYMLRLDMWRDVVEHFAVELAKLNVKFNRKRFLKACGASLEYRR